MIPTPGTKSSEFKLMLLMAALIVANGTEFVDIPWDTINWFAGTALGYGGFRTVVKGIAHSKNTA